MENAQFELLRSRRKHLYISYIYLNCSVGKKIIRWEVHKTLVVRASALRLLALSLAAELGEAVLISLFLPAAVKAG